MLYATRFSAVQSNMGAGFELLVIASSSGGRHQHFWGLGYGSAGLCWEPYS